MDTTVKCSKCFSHVDGFYTDGAGRRVCKDCATPPVPAELAALDALDEQGERWVGLVLADGAGKLRRHAKGVTFDDLFSDVPDDGEAAQ